MVGIEPSFEYYLLNNHTHTLIGDVPSELCTPRNIMLGVLSCPYL